MRFLIGLFLGVFLLVSVANAQVQIPQNQCVLKLGEKCYDKADNTKFESGTTGIILHTFVLTALRWTSLRKVQGTTGLATAYQVGGSSTLKVKALKIFAGSNSSALAQLCYCDDESTFDDTACTNFVYQMGNGLYATGLPGSGWGGPAGYANFGSGWVVPANKYPCMLNAGGNVGAEVYSFIE